MTLISEVLFGYQVEAAERIAEQKAILLADQPGLGKTLEVLGALEIAGLLNKPSRILITTPLINAQTTWVDSIARFISPRYDVEVVDVFSGTSKQKQARVDAADTSKPVFYVLNHNSLDLTKNGPRIVLPDVYWDAVIVDESHLVLPITGKSLTQFRKGLNKLRCFHTGAYRIAISGTPDRGKLENRFGTWQFLYPSIVGFNRYAWLEDNFFMGEQRVSRSKTIKVAYGLKDERKWQLFSNKWMIRRTKTEVLAQLPPKRFVDVELTLGAKQYGKYVMAQLRYEKMLNDPEANDGTAGMLFALRSRQLATCSWTEDEKPEPIVGGESIKLDWLLEWLDERGFIEADAMAENSQVVIVSQFSAVLHWLKKELYARGIVSDVLDGSTSVTSRAVIQERFQSGVLRVVLLSGGLGVGINLDRADDLIMFDSPYDPDRIEQIEDRVHRASNMHHVTIWNLIATHTIDEAIAEVVNKRYKTTRKLLDADRGINIERNVLKKLAILKGEEVI